jgi:hypothetical protein
VVLAALVALMGCLLRSELAYHLYDSARTENSSLRGELVAACYGTSGVGAPRTGRHAQQKSAPNGVN